MRVAVCLSGFMRNYKTALSSLRHLVLSPLQADLFISTWDVAGHSHYKWSNGKEREEKIKPEMLQESYGDHLKCMNITPLDIERITPAWIKKTDGRVYARQMMRRVASMYFHIHKANKLKRLYERINHFKYDVVIRLRPDISFRYPLTTWIHRTENRPGLVHTTLTENYGILNDQFMYGESSTMDKVARIYKAIQKKSAAICPPHQNSCLFDPAEMVLKHYLNWHKIEYHQHHLPYIRR